MNIVPRDVWYPDPVPRPGPAISTPTPRLWLHHGASGGSSVATAQSYVRYHIRTKGWSDVGYSYLIADGKVLEGRGPGRRGAHTRGDNHASHGICMVGSYHTRLPSSADLDALVWLIRHGIDRGWWSGTLTGGHRDAPDAATSCPGTALWRHIPEINRRATTVGTASEPKDDVMAGYDAELGAIVRNTKAAAESAAQQARLSAALVEAEVARIRAAAGLQPDPDSDAIWSGRLAAGSHTLADVKERLGGA